MATLQNVLEVDDQYSEDAIAEFVDKNQIKMRQCNKYILVEPNNKTAKDKKSTDCCCGRNYEWHFDEGIPRGDANEKWSIDKHTKKLPTTCFGTICFRGFGQEATTNAPYIRIDMTTKPRVIWDLVTEYWKLPHPRLIISVTGGAKHFFLKNGLKNSFKRGLVNVAMTTGAWIVTGGTNAGVMEFVGEAVKEYKLSSEISDNKLVVLGIATWGIVDNKESLEGSCPENGRPPGMFPACYNDKDLNCTEQKDISPLDNNHTHFILVDNGTERQFGAEISFRAEFEKYISQIETEVGHKQSVSVPVVLLMLEGGENTVKTALEAVQNDVPVVIIQGSGRAADVIAFAVNHFKGRMNKEADGKTKPINEDDYDKVKTKVADWLDWSKEEKDPEKKEKKIVDCVKNIQKMLQHWNLLTVFVMDDIDTTNEIDQAVLYALLKARKSKLLEQLTLALAWNRCDIARQEIFKNENRKHWRGEMNAIFEAMFNALVQNKLDFVQLFLDNGVELKDFLTIHKLRELYDEVVNDRYSGSCSSLLLHMLQREQSKWHVCCCSHDDWRDDLPNFLSLVGRIINNLAGDRYPSLYQGEKYIVKEGDEGEISKKDLKEQDYEQTLSSTAQSSRSVTRGKQRKATSHPDFANPEKDLMFWAVLLNRKDLAFLFWKLGKDHIGAALTASALFKSLSDAANQEEELDLSHELKMHSEEFEELATGVLNECYQRDKKKAHRLLIRNLDLWGDTTVMSIADSAEQMTLMGHSCCQTMLNKTWRGKMALYTSAWKIVLGLIFFPFIVPTIRFTTNDSGDLLDLLDHQGNKPSNNKVLPDTGEVYYHPSGPPPKKQKRTTLYNVGQCCDSSNVVHFCKAMYLFHTAPLVKFAYHTLSYVCFLCLFSFFLLTNMRHPHEGGPGTVEYIVWGWAATMILEEIRQVAIKDPRSVYGKFKSYFSSAWNQFDMIVYLMLLVTIIMRFQLKSDDFVWARRFYAVTLTLFFLRFTQTYYVEKNMGPKVIMIKKMVTDLVFFVLILAVFVFGYGVAVQVLRYPNAEYSWNILKNVVYMPYWNIYGELFLDDLQSDTGPSCPAPDPSNPLCPVDSWLVMILLALYMIFTNVLLLNLLIAMFSYTFERVQQNSEKVWRFHRYGLVFEYFDKPTLAPPLIIFTHIFRLIKFLLKLCKDPNDTTENKDHSLRVRSDFYEKLEKKENSMLTAFERVGMENHLIHRHLLTQEPIDNKVSSTGERIERVIEDLEQIREIVKVSADTKLALPTNMEELAKLTTASVQRTVGSDDIQHSQITILQEQIDMQHQQIQQMSSIVKGLTEKESKVADSLEHGALVNASYLNWDVSLPQTSHVESRSQPIEVISPISASFQRATPLSHRISRGPQPQIEIQEYPPGYTDT